MRRMLLRFLALLMFASAAHGDEPTLMSWDGVEVITNDFGNHGRGRDQAESFERCRLRSGSNP
jgi:hypothetical protein